MLEQFNAEDGNMIMLKPVSDAIEVFPDDTAQIPVILKVTDSVSQSEIAKMATILRNTNVISEAVTDGSEKMLAMASVLESAFSILISPDIDSDTKVIKLKETMKRATALSKVAKSTAATISGLNLI